MVIHFNLYFFLIQILSQELESKHSSMSKVPYIFASGRPATQTSGMPPPLVLETEKEEKAAISFMLQKRKLSHEERNTFLLQPEKTGRSFLHSC